MSSKATKKSRTDQIPLCRIGERVFLSRVDAADDFVDRIVQQATRQMDISAGDRIFRLHQLPNDFEASEFLDIQSFMALAGLIPAEQIALLKALFGTAMSMFRLQADPVLTQLAMTLSEAPGLPTAGISFDAIKGYETLIATIPRRATLRAEDLLISLTGDRLSLGRIESLHEFLARENLRQRLAAISFSGEAREGKYLLIGASGLVAVDAHIRSNSDVETFHAEHVRKNQDISAVYIQADADAAVALNRLSRQQGAASSVVDEPLLGLQFVVNVAIPLSNGLFASGWFHDAENRIASVVGVDHGIPETEISSVWKLFDGRADIRGKTRPVKCFAAFLPGERTGTPPAHIAVRLLLDSGESHLVTPVLAPQDLASQREAILSSIAGHAFTPDMLSDVFAPALAPIQIELNARQSVRHVKEFGPKSTRTISLIIPLYKETGFIRSQLMAFAIDPYLRDHCEIVYVLDDPLMATDVASFLEGYTFAFPFDLKLVTLDRNGGYAMANNMGVSRAEGDIVILMNSDVIPDRPGWIEQAQAKLSSLPAFSVIGPKLLYADDSLQHAGMYFYQLANGYWQNFHYWKGYGRNLVAADMERVTPAVTGACMIIRKDDYLAVGGFTPDYVIGDYEDSDLCLKLREKGGLPLYMPSIELYHFERQSMPVDSEQEQDLGSTVYNRALHTMRWNERIMEANAAGMDPANAE